MLLLVLAMYVPSLGNDFCVDGAALAKPTLKNGDPHPVMGELHGPAFYFQKNYWAGNEFYDALYRPIPIYTFALTNHLISVPSLSAEYWAVPHHVLDLLLHLLAVFLVWRLLLELAVKPPIALLFALLFGVHAIHHEVIVSIVGRSELISFTCGIGALLLYGRAGVPGKVGSSALLFLAFCSKESSLAWIAFLPCFELARGWIRGPRPWLKSLPLVVLPPLILWFFLRHNALEDMAHIPRHVDNLKNPLAFVDLTTQLLTAIKIWGFGIYKCLVPYPLSFLYGYGVFSLVTSPFDPGFLAASVLLLGVLAAGLRFARRIPLLFFATALILGFSFTTSNIPVVTGTIFGERLWYTPSLGFCLLVMLLLGHVAKYGKVPWICLAIYIVGNVAVVVHRNPLWDSGRALLEHDIHSQPNSANIQDTLSAFLWNRKPPDKEGALRLVDRAIEIYPEYPRALFKRASHHFEQKEMKLAVDYFVRCCQSPHIHIALRMAVQRGLESIFFPAGTQDVGLPDLDAARKANPDIAAVWATFIDRAMATSEFPRDRLGQIMTEGRQRFPADQLLAIQRGLFAAGDGIRDETEARAILDDLEPTVWRLLPEQRSMEYFIQARVVAAGCHAALSRRDTARHILDDLLTDPVVPPQLHARLQSAKSKILASGR